MNTTHFSTTNMINMKISNIADVESMDHEGMKEYIKNFLLPHLNKSYQISKPYLQNNNRRLVYSIKKALVDITEAENALNISANENEEIQPCNTKYQALYVLLDDLNMIYLFTVVARSKAPKNFDSMNVMTHYNAILRNIKQLIADVNKILESNPIQ